jgi:8-oxo-dGTP diphosphatase
MSGDSQRGVRRGVIGVASRGDELLLIQRAPTVPKGGAWCFPGGHVEGGETPRAAVQRELYEELGLRVAPTSRVGAVRILDSRHILAIWRVEITGGTLQPDVREIADVRWMNPGEIRALKFGLPSNEPVLKLLGL